MMVQSNNSFPLVKAKKILCESNCPLKQKVLLEPSFVNTADKRLKNQTNPPNLPVSSAQEENLI